MKNNYTARDITKMALMATITCIGVYLIKIPSLHGYAHLGDCMIFISVIVLGAKKGALAGGIGAALADMIGGYMQWIIPTFFIKYIMGRIMGLFIDNILPKAKWNWLIGSIVGGIVQIILYTLVKIPLYGIGYAIGGLVSIGSQTLTGIVLGAIFIFVFDKIHILQKIREM